jgi:hypothetical protein
VTRFESKTGAGATDPSPASAATGAGAPSSAALKDAHPIDVSVASANLKALHT